MKPIFAALLTIFFSAGSVMAAETPSLEGYWLVKKKDVLVRIGPCSKNSEILCGHIAWLNPEAKLQRDALNPDVSKRERALCGIRVMWDMKPDDTEKSSFTGQIYKANDGTIYDATMKLADADTLELRGYIGVPILGKTSKLTRANPKQFKRCD